MRLLFLLYVAAFFGSAVGSDCAAAGKPNILFLFSDDHYAGDIGVLSKGEVRTPHLDALYERGFHFTGNFCMGGLQGAVCVPSRAMVMTGRSLFRVKENLAGERLMPTALGEAGYVTFGTGKWHNGRPSFKAAFSRGANVFMGGMSDQAAVPVVDLLADGTFTPPRKDGTFSSQLFADAAITFLDDHAKQGGDKPFLCYVSFTHPHDPRTAPAEYHAMYDPAKITLPASYMPVHPFHNGEMVIRDEKLLPWPRTEAAVRREIADYHACITYMDAQIGRIIDTLRQTKQLENTIIVFAGDHGLAMGRHGLMGKQNLYEHSMRAPLVFAGPGIERGNSSALCYLNDVFPTLLELVDVKRPAATMGKSLVPVMRGKAKTHREALLLAYRDVQRAVRTDEWKLIVYPKINRTQLFHIAKDADELNDLSAHADQKDRVKGLMDLMVKLQAELGDKAPLTSATPGDGVFTPPAR